MSFTQLPPLCCAEGSVDSAGLKPKVVMPDLIRHPEIHTHSNKKAAPRWHCLQRKKQEQWSNHTYLSSDQSNTTNLKEKNKYG